MAKELIGFIIQSNVQVYKVAVFDSIIKYSQLLPQQPKSMNLCHFNLPHFSKTTPLDEKILNRSQTLFQEPNATYQNYQRISNCHKYHNQMNMGQKSETTLATVNINMGENMQKPVLIIKQSTNVHRLIQEFIEEYQLPCQAYSVIFNTIEHELNKQNINVHSLGKVTEQRVCLQENIPKNVPKVQQCKKKTNVCIKTLNQNNQGKVESRLKEISQNIKSATNIQRKQSYKGEAKLKKKSISPIRITPNKDNAHRIHSPQEPKVMNSRTKTPLRPRIKTKAQKNEASPMLVKTLRNNNTPNKPKIHHKKSVNTVKATQDPLEMQLVRKMESLFDILTKNQPKNIQTLSPQYINFDGIGPQTLSILQDFFENVHESEFSQMTKNYFINRMIEMGIGSKLTKDASLTAKNACR